MTPRTDIVFQNASSSPLGKVTLAGFIRNSTGTPASTMRYLGSYALVYTLGGEGRYADVRGNEVAVGTGDLILVFPELGHRYGPPQGRRWDEFFMVFEGPVFDLWRAAGLLDPARPVRRLGPVDFWLRRFEDCVAPDLPALEQICRLQAVLASALGRERSATGWLSEARAALEVDLARPLYLHRVARSLRMSPETFRKRFAREAGLPPLRYRQARIMDRACELLLDPALAVKEVAARLGFCDEFHFSRRFKHVTSFSPRAFRERLTPDS